jgi:hypothetical protein
LNVTFFLHGIAEKIPHLALNNNHSLYGNVYDEKRGPTEPNIIS